MVRNKVVDQLIPRADMKYKRLSNPGKNTSDQVAQLYSLAILAERLRPCAHSSTGDSRRTQ